MSRGVRVIVAGLIVVLLYGTVVHAVQLRSWPPYPWAPGWLAAYFVSLTVLDPLAAGLLAARRASGLYLAVAVLVSDAAANGYAVYALPDADGGGLARAGQLVVTVLAAVAIVTAPRVRNQLR